MENYKFPVYTLAGPTTKRICYLENDLLMYFHLNHVHRPNLKKFLITDSIPDQANKIHKIVCM